MIKCSRPLRIALYSLEGEILGLPVKYAADYIWNIKPSRFNVLAFQIRPVRVSMANALIICPALLKPGIRSIFLPYQANSTKKRLNPISGPDDFCPEIFLFNP